MVVIWMMRTFRWILLSSFIMTRLPAARSDISPPADDFRTKFDETSVEMNHFCGDAHLCRNKYPILTNITVNDLEHTLWNTTAVISPNEMNNIQFVNSMCHCDEECALYGDCCYDAAQHFAGKTDWDDSIDADAWQCLPLPKKDNFNHEPVSVYMVGKCPKQSQGEADLVAMCERHPTENGFYSHLMDIPVLSLDTNRTYVNVFCAQCYSDVSNLKEWTASVDCNIDEIEMIHQFMSNKEVEEQLRFTQSNYIRGERKWMPRIIVTHNSQSIDIIVNCSIIIQDFDELTIQQYVDLTNNRRCMADIRHCASDWPEKLDEKKCQAYSLYVNNIATSSMPSEVYNNPHCAHCNYIETNEISCFEGKLDKKLRGSSKKTVSFRLIFDFELGGSGGSRVGREKKCEDNETWDHLRNRCHTVVCGSLYENIAGECRLRASAHDGELDYNSTRMNSSCHRLTLTNQEFYQLANDSIIVNLTGERFDPGQYEIEPASNNVQICADASVQDYFDYDVVQNYLSDVCLSISVICLVLHIGLHLALPKLRNLPGKNLLSLSCALFVAQTIFLTSIRSTSIGGLCAFLGALTHWSYLAAFFWMNVMGYDICRTFTGKIHRSGRRDWTFRFYSLYAWGCPSLIVAVGVLLDVGSLWPEYAPSYGSHLCWISNRNGLGLFFVLPVALLLLQNVVLFALTVHSIWKQRKAAQFALNKNQSYRPSSAKERQTSYVATSKSNDPQKNQMRFVLYIKLALIMGLAWSFGFVAALAHIPELWYPFILFNALQGAFIFISFDCKKKIWFLIYLRVMKKPHPSTIRSTSKQGTGSNQRTSTVTTSTDITTGRVDVNASSPLSIASRRSSSLPSMHQIQSSGKELAICQELLSSTRSPTPTQSSTPLRRPCIKVTRYLEPENKPFSLYMIDPPTPVKMASVCHLQVPNDY